MVNRNEPYSYRACRFILRDMGECSCNDCIKFYLLEYEQSERGGNSGVGLRLLARENCRTGAINANLQMAARS